MRLARLQPHLMALFEPLRLCLLVEVVVLAAAAMLHAGLLLDWPRQAGLAGVETGLALVLLAGLAVGLWRPVVAVDAALAAQALALLGMFARVFLQLVAPLSFAGFALPGLLALLLAIGLSITWEGALPRHLA